jgi:alkylation response protein AidB-like acyl-CoA dehydrogenase
MDFDLPSETRDLQAAVAQWSRRRIAVRTTGNDSPREQFDRTTWREALTWGVLGLRGAENSALNRAVVFAEIATGCGLPGPLLEADIAATNWPAATTAALDRHAVVTTVAPGRSGPALVAWGAVADLVIDETSGEVVAAAPMPELARFAYPLPHAWWSRPTGVTDDPLLVRKWILGGALLVGLARGALALTVEHTRNRTQFGKPLAANQAIQFPLAECKMNIEAAWLMVADAAARADDNDPKAEASAALAWLHTTRAADALATHCHQAFGALGFCFETGLVDFTWPMRWLRLSISRTAARDTVHRLRSHGYEQKTGGSLVLEGFSTR